jgi:hypothetical protein
LEAEKFPANVQKAIWQINALYNKAFKQKSKEERYYKIKDKYTKL